MAWSLSKEKSGDEVLTAALKAKCPPRHMPVAPTRPVQVGKLSR